MDILTTIPASASWYYYYSNVQRKAPVKQ